MNRLAAKLETRQREPMLALAVLVAVIMAIATTTSYAQNTTSAINGTVTDSTGAVVVGAGI